MSLLAPLQLRRGTSAQADASDVILLPGEPAWITDTEELIIGDGVSPISSLPRIGQADVSGLIAISAIVNGLTETTSGKVLDARQGKALKDLIDAVAAAVTGKQDSLGFTPVPNSRTVNGQALTGNVVIGPSDLTETTSKQFVSATEKSTWNAKDTTAISALRNGVPTAGDDLNKLYSLISAINAIIGGSTADGDALVNTVAELLDIFDNYPEGVDLATVLGGKVDTSAIVNILTETGSGKALDARQGKTLKDLIDALTTTVSGKQDSLGFTAVPNTRTVNGQPLSGNVVVGPADIAQTASYRFVSDAEKTAWNAKDISAITTLRNGVPTAGDDLAKLYAMIQAINAIIGGSTADGDALVNTVKELLDVFATYSESVDIATLINSKIAASAIVNNLLQTASGGVLDARQGKVLSDLITTLTTTVAGKAALTISTSDPVSGAQGLFHFKSDPSTPANERLRFNRDGANDFIEILTANNKTLSDVNLTGTPLVPTATPGTNTQQAASTAFVAAALAAAVTGLLELQGNLDCSANPNYPAGSKGDLYYVSVAGKIGGASGKSVDVGDAVICKADNAGGTEASAGTSWFVLEHNLAGALLAANNLSDLANAATARGNLGLSTKTQFNTACTDGDFVSTDGVGMPCEFTVAVSDETTLLTTGTAKITFRMEHAMTLSSVRLSVNTAPTGAAIIVDVNEGGASIFSTNPQIAAGSKTSVGGAVPGAISDTALADDAEITIDIDQVGSTIAGKGLKVTFKGTRA